MSLSEVKLGNNRNTYYVHPSICIPACCFIPLDFASVLSMSGRLFKAAVKTSLWIITKLMRIAGVYKAVNQLYNIK